MKPLARGEGAGHRYRPAVFEHAACLVEAECRSASIAFLAGRWPMHFALLVAELCPAGTSAYSDAELVVAYLFAAQIARDRNFERN